MKTSEWEFGNITPEKLAHGYRWLNEKWNEETYYMILPTVHGERQHDFTIEQQLYGIAPGGVATLQCS
jgi:hypothetical protein